MRKQANGRNISCEPAGDRVTMGAQVKCAGALRAGLVGQAGCGTAIAA